MNKQLTATARIKILAGKEEVWKALTSPEIIKQYFFGTDTITDWKVGSPIVFKGEWEGKKYEDRGSVLSYNRPEHLKFTYWSSMSGLEDRVENYSDISYDLEEIGSGTELTVTQTNLPNEQMKAHSEENWKKVLEGLKKILES